MLVLFGTLALLSIGIGLVVALALGAADPQPAGPLRWHATAPHDWQLARLSAEQVGYTAPVHLPAPPFTLELQAINIGLPDSGWGMWLEADPEQFTTRIDNSGYLARPDWRQFPHIRPNSSNRLTLDVEHNNHAVLRINDEIAWNGTLTPALQWGIVLVGQPALDWQTIRLYAPD